MGIKIEDIKEFEEKIKTIEIFEMSNQEFSKELTRLIILLGDIFAMVRLDGKRDFRTQQQLDDAKKEIRFLKEKLKREEKENENNKNSNS